MPKQSGDIVVTKRMLDEVRDELKSDIASLRIETKAGFDQLRAEVQKQNSISHRCLAIYEEQNARNKYVLDGYDQIYRRQEEYEKRLKTLGA